MSTEGKDWKLKLGRTGSLSKDRMLNLFIVASRSGKVSHFAGSGSDIELDQTDLFRSSNEISQFGAKGSEQLQTHVPGTDWAAFETDGRDGFKVYCAEKTSLAPSRVANDDEEEEDAYFLVATLHVPKGVQDVSRPDFGQGSGTVQGI